MTKQQYYRKIFAFADILCMFQKWVWLRLVGIHIETYLMSTFRLSHGFSVVFLDYFWCFLSSWGS